jgi:hypothetical protein
MNAGVGWYQEKQAGDIVAQLKKGITLKATVCISNYQLPRRLEITADWRSGVL